MEPSVMPTAIEPPPFFFDADGFFREQDDLVSEILSFLDLRSMLTMSTTSRKAASLLRYDHVFAVSEPSAPTTAEKNSRIVLDKLSKVYHLEDNRRGRGSVGAPAAAQQHKRQKQHQQLPPSATKLQSWKARTKPTPLRLLKLVNGRKCETCLRDLRSPCIWAGRSGFGTVVLPSLSFGAFRCTQCIFVVVGGGSDESASSATTTTRRLSPSAAATAADAYTNGASTAIPSTMRHPLLASRAEPDGFVRSGASL